MNSNSQSLVVEPSGPSSNLVERMDTAIGETSSLVGAVLTEVVRRALRGGVGQIGEQLNEHAADAVTTAVAERIPSLERSVVQLAGVTSRSAALEAVEGRVAEAEARTDDARRLLGERIAEAERTAEARAEEARRTLTERITEAERAARAKTEETSQVLTGRIDATREQVETVGQELHGRLQQAEKKAWEQTESTALALRSEIEAAAQRVEQEARTALNARVDELRERSRKGTAVLKARLLALEGKAGALASKLEAGEQAHREVWLSLRGEIETLRSANEALVTRVRELEKPRGLRWLWHRLFGRKQG
jgi:hypothetical protein